MRGGHIEIRSFGTFKVQHRKARAARNPRTGKPVQVPPRVVPIFKPSRHLRGRVDRVSGASGEAKVATVPEPRRGPALSETSEWLSRW